ncbi:UDP-N-acetylglucosamine--LPS N-acetylglucosamine transferase [Leptothermofonsia sichuanensis E412]|uniref:MGDG synthase family glycosyltransferase n=1 Tax=Leptothermofonsia sichuanensis TaxID=2917832 RepID=UPI001CA6B672|nr:UDP-N-acetylglucosamine--LPS N-acetylglucosamine transferase [Leptothermofonsia sichuanensis]QZZ22253.1 UDP-N-acetylglucosamine--LPS N-acetylglucosamine transferase [Leptothermofonsia sichuanensis E412]
MTRILILYASLGSGHISAAKALREAFTRYPGVEVQIEDAFDHASPLLRETITTIYERLSERVPHLYRVIYEGSDVEDLEESMNDNLLFAKIERPFLKDLERLIKDSQSDAIICVQQIPSRLLQLMNREGELPQPHYVVVTDVMAHSTWLTPGVKGYFLPSDLTAEVLVQRGVEPSLVHVTGIPVKLEIAEPKSQEEMRQRHNLPPDLPVVTLFGGGLQAKRVRLMISRLLDSPNPGMLIVVAGRNESLLEKLEDLSDGAQMKLRKLGMIDYVDDLVVASDLVITKAGGLITSEILARGTPMVIIDPFPGQEEWNADVVSAMGAGVQLRLPGMVPPTVLHLLNQPDQLAFMRQKAPKIGQPLAALKIANIILEQLQSSKSLSEKF